MVWKVLPSTLGTNSLLINLWWSERTLGLMLTEGNLQSSWLHVGQEGSLDSLLHGHGFSVSKYSNGGLSIDGHQFW